MAVLYVVLALAALTTLGSLWAVRRERAVARALRAVAGVMRDLSSDTDARRQMCQAALDVSGAAISLLLEPDGENRLVVTASAGRTVKPFKLALDGEPSGSATAFRTGEPRFISDARRDPSLSRPRVEEMGAVSVMLEPVRRGEAVVGVLAVVWRRRVRTPSTPGAMAIRLLAAEAGVAIERCDMLTQLESLARTDPLTGLPNRRSFDEGLESSLALAGRQELPLCVAIFDIDDFKLYNDRHGHQAGDRLLKELTAVWRGQVRQGDLLARYGGDEFAVILPVCSPDAGCTVIDRVRLATTGEHTCSAGVASWDRQEPPEALIARADEALYRAKNAGRNRTVSV